MPHPHLQGRSLGRRAAAHNPAKRRLWADRHGVPVGWCSKVDALGEAPGVLDLDAEVTDRAVHLRVAEQQLDGAQVASLLVELRDLRSWHGMGAVGARLKADPRHPPRRMRAYCRVDRCGLSRSRLGQRNSTPPISGSAIQRSKDWRVDSVISKRTGLPVLLWIIAASSFTCPAAKTSRTRRQTRSQPGACCGRPC